MPQPFQFPNMQQFIHEQFLHDNEIRLFSQYFFTWIRKVLQKFDANKSDAMRFMNFVFRTPVWKPLTSSQKAIEAYEKDLTLLVRAHLRGGQG